MKSRERRRTTYYVGVGPRGCRLRSLRGAVVVGTHQGSQPVPPDVRCMFVRGGGGARAGPAAAGGDRQTAAAALNNRLHFTTSPLNTNQAHSPLTDSSSAGPTS